MLVAAEGDGPPEARGLASAAGWGVLPVIAARAVLVSELGLRLGARLGTGLREGVERVAGIALLAVGAGLLVEMSPCLSSLGA